MPEHALKEWASVIGAMLSGEQVVMLRKGGIGEARFDVPCRRFFRVTPSSRTCPVPRATRSCALSRCRA